MAKPTDEFPEPTIGEARTLLLSAILALAGFSAYVLTLAVTHRHDFMPPLASLPSGIITVASAFTFGSCALSIAYRGQGSTLGQEIKSFRPDVGWRSLVPRSPPPGLWRPLTPSYLRRAARVAGWSERATTAALAALIGVAVASVVVSITA